MKTIVIQPRHVIQFSEGPKKGMFAQVISTDGPTPTCYSRDMDGSGYRFNPGPEESYLVVGHAALGPRTEQSAQQPNLPPPLNPEELLEPLPADVPIVPMNVEYPEGKQMIQTGGGSQPKKKSLKPKPAPYTGPLAAWLYTVTNGSGDTAEVTLNVRPDKSSKSYNGAAIIQATRAIPAIKPYKVQSHPKA